MTRKFKRITLEHPCGGAEWDKLAPGDDGEPYEVAPFSHVTFHVTEGSVEIEGSIVGEKYDLVNDYRGLPLRKNGLLTVHDAVRFVRPVNNGPASAMVSIFVRR